MYDKKELINYNDMGGEIKEKYETLDVFLKLTERFDRTGKRKAKTRSLVVFTALAAAMAGLAVISGNILLWPIALMFLAAGVGLTVRISRVPFPDEVRSKGIIEKDGLDAVYGDLVEAEPVEGTNIYVGRKYLFLKGQWVMRLADIKALELHDYRSKENRFITARAEFGDEFGSGSIELMRLPENEYKKQAMFKKISDSIGTAWLELTGEELKLLNGASEEKSLIEIE